MIERTIAHPRRDTLLVGQQKSSERYVLILDKAHVSLVRHADGSSEPIPLKVPNAFETFCGVNGGDDTDPRERKRWLHRFSLAIGQEVEIAVEDGERPIVLAGDGEFQDSFRSVFWHPRLIDESAAYETPIQEPR